jgi:hypothetical protein
MKKINYWKPASLTKKIPGEYFGENLAKKIRFEELCPIWADRLNSGLSEEERVMLAHDSKHCIVGEAWNFSGRYAGYYVAPLIPIVGCWKCVTIGRQFGRKSRTRDIQRIDLEPIIEDFMAHWTEKHAKRK